MPMPKEALANHAYELLKMAVPILNGLPRAYKFTLGDRLQNHLTDLLESLIEANYLPPAEKRPLLQRINLRLEKMRFLFRLGFELGLYNSVRYHDFVARIDGIGRMTGGWLKTL